MRQQKLTAIVLALMLIAPSAHATKIFLNGVDITDVSNKTFNKVKSVHIDTKGDIYIDAPQYEVKVLEAGGEPDATSTPALEGSSNPASLKERYYIASQGPAAKVQYKLTISVNNKVRMVIGATESSAIEEITGWLKKGKNVIHVTAVKELGNHGRVSTDKDDEISLLIGSGHEENNNVIKIDSLKATFKCDASTTNTFTREYTIHAR